MEGEHLARDMKEATEVGIVDVGVDAGAKYGHVENVIYRVEDHIGTVEEREKLCFVGDIDAADLKFRGMERGGNLVGTLLAIIGQSHLVHIRKFS
jgi:hypothetical protein